MSEFKLENLHALMEQRRLQLEITREQLAVQVGVSLQELTSSDPRWSTLSRMLEWSGCLLLEVQEGGPRCFGALQRAGGLGEQLFPTGARFE